MSLEERRVSNLRRAVSNWVAPDILVVWAIAATVFVLATWEVAPVLRTAVVAPAVFLLPGYVTVALLYPYSADAESARAHRVLGATDGHLGGIDLRDRVALSFGLSLAVLPLLGIGIGLSPWAFSGVVAVRAFVGFVAVVGLLAALRRRRIAPADRFRVPVDRWSAEVRDALGAGSTSDRVLNAVLIAAVLLALGTLGYALAAPPAGQQYTEFAVLTESGGELVAGDYPESLAPGESASLVTAVENHNREPVEYTVVVTAERPGDQGAAEEVELRRFEETVAPGERWTNAHEVTPQLAGDDVRLNYYLYRGGAPDEPERSSALHHLYVWTSVGDDTA